VRKALNKNLLSISKKNMFMKDNAPYKCELCHEGFDGENNFNRHVELVHEGKNHMKRNLWNLTYVINDFK
jgi:hypothetical protein